MIFQGTTDSRSTKSRDADRPRNLSQISVLWNGTKCRLRLVATYRRNYSTQYISVPEFSGHVCARESPEKYGSYVDLVTDEWTKVALPKSQSFRKE